MDNMSTIDDMIAEPAQPRSPAQDQSGMFVDRFEGDTAVVLKQGPGGVTEHNVPRSSLPRGTREGDYVTPDAMGSSHLYGQQPDDGAIINSIYGSSFPR